jgi:hypothetical protein
MNGITKVCAVENEKSQFERMSLTSKLERDREIVAQYEAGLAYYRQRIEDARYELGRLGERLGDH